MTSDEEKPKQLRRKRGRPRIHPEGYRKTGRPRGRPKKDGEPVTEKQVKDRAEAIRKEHGRPSWPPWATSNDE